jgi:multicomponent K+:H+ antiporter subunit D
LQVTEVIPIAVLLVLCMGITVQAGPVFGFVERTSADLHQPGRYIERVLNEPVVPGVLDKGN